MNSKRSVCVLMCVFCFCFCCALGTFSVQELTVTPTELKDCEEQKKLCVMSSTDCRYMALDRVPRIPENFLNTSCHYLIHEDSLTCRWIQTKDVRSKTISSFIFSRVRDIFHCPSILNMYSTFNLTIKSKSVINQREQFSDVYPLFIKDIIQAPRPLITSVNVTDSSIKITWTSGKIPLNITKCKIRYKLLDTESWTETASVESQLVIEGLQAFSEFALSVSCFHGFGRWSDWSHETRVKTAESPPSAALSFSYYVDSDENAGIRWLVLLWKALDITDARGLIRGYEVSYMPIRQPSLKKTMNTTHLKAVVPVRSEEYEVSVCAYNSAGRSPYRRLTVNPSRPHDVPAVKSLWVYSDGSSLWIRWEHQFTTVNVSEFAIEWSSTTNSEHRHWERVNGSTFTVRLPGIEAQQMYIISVFPVYESLCGPPTNISADLQHGALWDLVGFGLLSVSSSSVVLRWSWKEAKPGVSVLQYRLVLNGPNETQTLTVFPDKHQHSFLRLHPNTRYSVQIHGETTDGNFTKASLAINTLLLDYDEMMRFAVPAVLLLLIFGIFSVLSRTMCREYFFPIIANPRYSPIGRWLLNPHLQQGSGKICVLKLDGLILMDQQMEKSTVQVERHVSVVSDHEDEVPLKISATAEDTALWKPGSDYGENALTPSSLTDYIDLPLLPDSSGYVQTGQIPGERSSD
ncbi:interleukin-6 receptor subunit beta isoform X1 [Onychostoma macrolepis]|uniref:interleukin-6 receptor subunit beta isoform X1 n=1 Tax=Onychostoma macrolepis TaxID=369639 RepID=UPI00272D3972|nr:interleukin-6 receptor subunit beta isoform X1 [Onychostoma macrolepis]XP_058641471.1 interleukin-6 receptor subunit beta isoform X1 [Onychostoma macrolepis]XP_058641472.1 interleukin-6 receptor subunit beta isoform X1 [Onychostoma macrolepis]